MKTVKSEFGFTIDVDETLLDNMELVDALAEMQDDSPLAISKVCKLALGEKKRKELYDHLRKENGTVPTADVTKAIIEIFNAFGDKGKNS
jgi:hypothetical protein